MGLIRLLLAVTVLLWHCPVGMVSRIIHPALAVQCFYSISGFLIQMVLRSSDKSALGWKKSFYISRWLRIFPLYAIFFLLSLTLAGAGSFIDLIHKEKFFAAAIWVLNNALIVGQDVLRFFYYNYPTGHFMILPSTQEGRTAVHAISGRMTMMEQSWTLAIEFYFYLLAPFLLLRKTVLLASLVALSIGLRIYLGYSGHFLSEWVYGFFPSELGVFLLGSLAYRVYAFFFASGRIAAITGERALLALCSLAVISVIWVYTTIDLNFAGGSAQWEAAPLGVAPGYWVVLLGTILSLPFVFYFSVKIKWDRAIGELSYPVYICHFFVLNMIMQKLRPGSQETAYVGLAVLIISILLSILLVMLIEKPVDRLRHRIFHRRKDSPEAPALLQPHTL